MERNYYMVRIKDNRFDVAERESIVGIGWSDYDFSNMAADEITNDIAGGTKKKNDIIRFMSIKKGDIILVPHWNCVWLAEATSEHIYHEESKQYDIANQIRVKYQKAADGSNRLVSRNQLTEGLARRLRMPGGVVLNLNEYGEEIKRIFYDEDYSISKQAADNENKLLNQFKDDLLNNICKGNVFLKAGGRGLEELVSELFEIEGFRTNILAKNSFSEAGDADVEAEMSFANTKFSLLIQVKHYQGNTGIWGIEQLETLKVNGEAEGYDKLMFITSGDINEIIRKRASEEDILTMDGKELVEWICNNINKLSDETRAALKVSVLPMIWG